MKRLSDPGCRGIALSQAPTVPFSAGRPSLIPKAILGLTSGDSMAGPPDHHVGAVAALRCLRTCRVQPAVQGPGPTGRAVQ